MGFEKFSAIETPFQNKMAGDIAAVILLNFDKVHITPSKTLTREEQIGDAEMEQKTVVESPKVYL